MKPVIRKYEAFFLDGEQKNIHEMLLEKYPNRLDSVGISDEIFYVIKNSIVISQSKPEEYHKPIGIINDKNKKTKASLEKELKCILKEKKCR